MNHFEWDEIKREANLKKHGMDFVDAMKVFEDADRIEMESTRNGEKRYQMLGTINDMVVLLVYICRSERKRIISARRASKKGREVY